ncbi:MAG TPA: hypothetical protein VGM56_27895 [Byssovorax sp.]
MTARVSRRVALGALAALAAGCAAPWRPIARAAGAPFAGTRRLRVMPVEFAGVRVSGLTEAAWLAEQNDDEKKRFAIAKSELSRAFADALVAAAAEYAVTIERARARDQVAFEIVPRVPTLEPGSFRSPFDTLPSVVLLRVRLVAPSGAADEIELESTTQATQILKGTDDRLRHDGALLGEAFAAYLKTRLV